MKLTVERKRTVRMRMLVKDLKDPKFTQTCVHEKNLEKQSQSVGKFKRPLCVCLCVCVYFFFSRYQNSFSSKYELLLCSECITILRSNFVLSWVPHMA